MKSHAATSDSFHTPLHRYGWACMGLSSHWESGSGIKAHIHKSQCGLRWCTYQTEASMSSCRDAAIWWLRWVFLSVYSVEENSLIQSHDPFPEIAHIQWWMQGTKPGPPTFIQNNLKGPFQLQASVGLADLCRICMARQLPLPSLLSSYPHRCSSQEYPQCTYISACESAFQRASPQLRYPRWLGSNANKPDGIKTVSERLYWSEGSWSATEIR